MKRIISIVIFVCTMLIFSAIVHADSDKNSERFMLAQDLIEALSDDYVLADDSQTIVTRAEFVFTLMEVLGYNGSVCSFEDVPQKHFAYSAIAAVENMGMTQQNSMFYPDKAMTYQNAVEIAVTVLGYKEKAEYYGGYPSGYLRVANELRLNKGMDGKQMTVNNTIMVIFNMVNSYPLEMAAVKKNVASYTPSEETLLYKYRKIAFAEGIVTADEASGLTNVNDACAEDSIVIGDNVYYGSIDNSLLGRNCAVYYTETVKNSIVCARPYLNETHKIDIRHYDRMENGSLMYDKNTSATGRLRIDSSYVILYNRKTTKNMNPDEIIKDCESGFVEVIDNDNDGRYDVIAITAYEYAWVSGIDLINKVIYDRTGKKNIDLSDSDIVTDVKTLNGDTLTSTDLSEISPESLIAYAESEDKKAYSIVICYNSIDSNVTSVESIDDIIKAVADGKEYYVNSYIYNFTKDLKGAEGTFYLGVNGELAAVAGTNRTLNYGYIYRTGVTDDEQRPFVRMLTDSGICEMFTFAENVMIDGETQDIYKVWDDLSSEITASNKTRVVRYKLKNNEIKILDTADEITSITDFSTAKDPNNSLLVYYDSEITFNGEGATFSPMFNVGASTVNFVIPSDADDISKYRVEGTDYFVDDCTYEVVAYDISGNSSAGVTLTVDTGEISGVSYNNQSAVVSKIENTINEDDEPIYAITLWQNGMFTRYLTDTSCEGDIENIEKGDIIRYKLSDNLITYVIIDYDLSSAKITAGIDRAGARLEYFHGKVFSLAGGYSYIYTGTDTISSPVQFSNLRNAKISGVATALVEIDKAGNIEVKNTSADVIRDFISSGKDADNIVIRQRYYVSQLNVIYRNVD